MAVDKLNPQSLALIATQHQRSIHTVIVVLLVLYLLSLAADWVWRLAPTPSQSGQTPAASVQNRGAGSQSQGPAVNLRALQQLNLFGQVNQPQVASQQQEQVTDAPETRLNLVLTGAVLSSDVQSGAAIIEHSGKQNTYGIGDKIDGTNATLRQVQADRVIIRNGARNETLMLEGVDYDEANRARRANQTASTTRPTPPRSPVTSRTPKISKNAAEMTRQLRSSPDSFTDFISISPYRENNEMVGYRVRPGKNPDLFAAAGLETGDVITQINSLDVTDPDQTMEAMNELRRSDTIELTVSRNGELVTLYLELPEPDDA